MSLRRRDTFRRHRDNSFRLWISWSIRRTPSSSEGWVDEADADDVESAAVRPDDLGFGTASQLAVQRDRGQFGDLPLARHHSAVVL